MNKEGNLVGMILPQCSLPCWFKSNPELYSSTDNCYCSYCSYCGSYTHNHTYSCLNLYTHQIHTTKWRLLTLFYRRYTYTSSNLLCYANYLHWPYRHYPVCIHTVTMRSITPLALPYIDITTPLVVHCRTNILLLCPCFSMYKYSIPLLPPIPTYPCCRQLW